MLVVAETLTAGSHASHAPGRRQEDDLNLVAHTLRGEGHDGSEDGTGRGVPLVTQALTGTFANGGADDNKAQGGFLIPVVARALTAPASPRYDGDTKTFVVEEVSKPIKAAANLHHDESHEAYVLQDVRGRTRDKTDDGQGIGIREGDGPMYTLDATQQHAVAYQCQGSNVGEMGTLRAGNGALTGGVPFVQDTPAFALRADPGGTGQGHNTNLVFGISNQPTPKFGEDVVPSLDAKESGGDRMEAVAVGMGVRRLTPRECERLQGFPDGWTDVGGIRVNKRDGAIKLIYPTPDSPRYRAAGNAVAVPVVEWIAGRIAEVDATKRRGAWRDA